MSVPDQVKALRQRIREAIGGKPKAGKPGIPRSTIEGWINGPTLPKLGQFLDFCEEVGRDPAWFFGEEEPAVDDTVAVQKLDVRAAAGGGALNGLQNIKETIEFPRWMIAKLVGDKSRLRAVRAHGDSMEPLIRSGALLLVDETDRDFTKIKKPSSPWQHTDIFVFSQGDELRLKRFHVDPKGLIIASSENPAYGPEVLRKHDIKVHGRVVWWDNVL